MPECEDCEEQLGTADCPGKRRTRCKFCQLLVCAWCLHHVHNGLHVNVPKSDAG